MGFLGGPPGEDQAFLCGELLDCGGGVALGCGDAWSFACLLAPSGWLGERGCS